MTLALIDGDIVAYRAAAVLSRGIDWGEGAPVSLLDPQEAADAACQTIEAWARLAKAAEVLVAFTGRENFRKRVLPSYKANRAGKVKPIAYNHVVAAVTARFATQVVEGLEADDVLGIMLTNPKHHNAVCLTLDKDLRTVPGWHLNPLKENTSVLVGIDAATRMWMSQTLTGDTSDGYVGIPGIGAKRAAAIIGPRTGEKTIWAAVLAAYHKAGLTEADALTQARCARILRRGDYDRTTQEILLWHPTLPVRIAVRDPSK